MKESDVMTDEMAIPWGFVAFSNSTSLSCVDDAAFSGDNGVCPRPRLTAMGQHPELEYRPSIT